MSRSNFESAQAGDSFVYQRLFPFGQTAKDESRAMSLTYAENFPALLRTLRLVEGSLKPFPSNTLTSSTTSAMGYSNFYGAGLLGTPIDATFNVTGPGLSYINVTTFHPAIGDGTSAQCPVVSYDSPPLTNQNFWSFDSTAAAVYRYRKQQSVNLGSW